MNELYRFSEPKSDQQKWETNKPHAIKIIVNREKSSPNDFMAL